MMLFDRRCSSWRELWKRKVDLECQKAKHVWFWAFWDRYRFEEVTFPEQVPWIQAEGLLLEKKNKKKLTQSRWSPIILSTRTNALVGFAAFAKGNGVCESRFLSLWYNRVSLGAWLCTSNVCDPYLSRHKLTLAVSRASASVKYMILRRQLEMAI